MGRRRKRTNLDHFVLAHLGPDRDTQPGGQFVLGLSQLNTGSAGVLSAATRGNSAQHANCRSRRPCLDTARPAGFDECAGKTAIWEPPNGRGAAEILVAQNHRPTREPTAGTRILPLAPGADGVQQRCAVPPGTQRVCGPDGRSRRMTTGPPLAAPIRIFRGCPLLLLPTIGLVRAVGVEREGQGASWRRWIRIRVCSTVPVRSGS